MDGSIPSQLGNLSALEFLDLAYNGLQNSIPTSLGRLSNLKELFLNESQLSGSIPSQLGDLTNLEKLILDSNRLNGSIPADLGDLTNLEDLNLARNELSGAIPSELGDLLNLEDLNLNDNGLSSNIPAELGNLLTSTDDDDKPLDYISLSCNLLTGNVPSELGDLPSLQILLLDNNKLNTEPADRPASFSNIGYVRWTSGNVCPRGQPDVEPPSSDDAPPTFEEAELSRDGLTIVLTYNESLDSSNVPATTDFTVKVDDQAVTVSTVEVRIREVRLGLGGAVTEHQGVTVAYTDPTSGDDTNAIQDRAGNDADSLIDEPVTNVSTATDGTAPKFVRAVMSSNGQSITLTYDEVLDADRGPANSDFTVKVDGESVTLSTTSSPTVRGRTVVVGLESAVTAGQDVTVTYTDPSTSDDNSAIQDPAGNDAATLTDQTVTNRVGQRPRRPTTPQTPGTSGTTTSGTSTPGTPPSETQMWLDVILTVPEGPAEVGQTLSYAVTARNSGTQPLTGVTWRDTSVDPAAAWQSLGDLAVGASTTASGSFGPIRADHIPHNIPDLLLTLPDGSETTCNFLTHYQSTGGLARWGYTTSEVLEERPGTLTQYYQRGVVDCHEREGAWPMERRLAWDHFGGGIDGSEDLGYEPDLLSDQPGQLLGPWGHRVSDYAVDGTYTGFLSYFRALGGVSSFGFPKSEARWDNDPRRQLGIAAATEGFIR